MSEDAASGGSQKGLVMTKKPVVAATHATGPSAQPAFHAAPFHRLPQLSWLLGLAISRDRFTAALAWPAAVLTLLPFMLRRGVFVSRDGDGLVIVARYRPVVDTAITLGIILLCSGVPLSAVRAAAMSPSDIGLIVLGLITLTSLLLFCCLIAGAVVLGPDFSKVVGRETPRGRRWIVAGLSQHPNVTAMSAMLLARQVLRALPQRGDIIVASTPTSELRTRLLLLGFTAGRRRRLHTTIR